MQANNLSDDVEGNPDREDPFYQQGKVACVMFTVLLILSFLVIGIVTGVNFKKNPQEDQTRGLLSDDITAIPFQYRGRCSDGWVSYKNTCYLLGNVYGTWEVSQSVCHNKGAHLMVVNSEEELTVTIDLHEMTDRQERFDLKISKLKLLRKKDTYILDALEEFISRTVQKQTDYWIGLKRDKLGKWSWDNGDDHHSAPHFWDENQPAHGGMESCVHLKGTDTVRRKLLHDADCYSERYFICERKLEKGMW